MRVLLILTLAIVIIRVASAEGPIYNFHFHNGASEGNLNSIAPGPQMPVAPQNNLVEKIEPVKEKSNWFFALELGGDISSDSLEMDDTDSYGSIDNGDGMFRISGLFGIRNGLSLRVGIGMGQYEYEGYDFDSVDYEYGSLYGSWEALEFSVGIQKEIRMGKYFSILAGLNYRWMSSQFDMNWDSGDIVEVSTSTIELSIGPQVNFGNTIYLNFIAGIGQEGGKVGGREFKMTAHGSAQLNLGIRM